MANVFFLADSLPLGGVTSYVKTIAAALAQRGHQVSILINEGDDLSEEPWPDRVAFRQLPVKPSHTRAGLTRELRQLLLKEGAEWVFFNNCYYLDSYAVRGTDIRGVYVIHSNMEEEVDRFLKEGLWCRNLIGPTPGVADRFRRAAPGRQVDYIAHGTHVPSSQPIKHTPFHVVYLGRLPPEKGVDLLPGIMAPLLRRYPEMHLTVLGNGKGREAFASGVIDTLRGEIPEGQLHLPGTLDRRQLDDLLHSAHVLLLPSREEAFGLAAIEGAAWGAVPVVTRIAGVTDRIFTAEADAFLLPQDDVAAFSAAIERLYLNSAHREKMASAAYNTVRTRFSIEVMADAYERLMQSPAPPPPPPRTAIQRAFGIYRNLLFLQARKALH